MKATLRLLAALLLVSGAPALAENKVKKKTQELGEAIQDGGKKLVKKGKDAAQHGKAGAKKAWKKTKAYIHEKTAD